MKTKSAAATRTLLYEDTDSLELYITRLRQIAPTLDKIKTAYESLELGAFTDDVYKNLLDKGTEEIEAKYINDFNSKVQRLPATIRQSSEKNRDELLKMLKMALNNLHQQNNSGFASIALPLDALTFADGVPTITESDRETILERNHRIYIDGEIEHDIYSKLKALEFAFNDCLELFNYVNFKPYFSIQTLENIFNQDDQTKQTSLRVDATHYITNIDKDIKHSKRFEVN